jgi:hypothetical protein
MALTKFNKVYSSIISEGIFKKALNSLRSDKSKHQLIKSAIQKWVKANHAVPVAGKDAVFDVKGSNGETIRFSFNKKEWNNPESKSIAFRLYAKYADGTEAKIINNAGEIDYGFSEDDISDLLYKMLKEAVDQIDASSFTTTKKLEKKRKQEKKAAEEAAEKERFEDKSFEDDKF